MAITWRSKAFISLRTGSHIDMVIDHDVVIDVKSNIVQITRLNPLTPSITRYFFGFVNFACTLTIRKGSRMLTGKKKSLQLFISFANSRL